MTNPSGEFLPEIMSAVDNVWLDQARERMRQRIVRNLAAIRNGDYTEEELAFAKVVRPEDDPTIANPEDILAGFEHVDAWNEYMKSHPEASDRIEAEDRLREVREVMADQQAIRAYSQLDEPSAIEQVIADREEEIIWMARFHQTALGIAARYGFSI